MLWGGRRVPFTLIGGYLGAGKTTLLNHLLRQSGGRRLAVLVNDIGAVNVDAALIAAHDGETLTLTNGCVCCAIADDLGLTLERIRNWTEPPDHVVMELSGVAEPSRVAPWASTPGFRLDGVIIVADAEQLGGQLERDDIGDPVRAQLVAADLVVISKVDLTDDGGAHAADTVSAISDAPTVRAVNGAVDPDVVLGVQRRDPAIPGVGSMPAHDVEMLEVGRITVDELDDLVDGLPAEVVRAKGLIACSDSEAPVEVHVVGRRRSTRRRPDLPVTTAGGVLLVVRLGVDDSANDSAGG